MHEPLCGGKGLSVLLSVGWCSHFLRQYTLIAAELHCMSRQSWHTQAAAMLFKMRETVLCHLNYSVVPPANHAMGTSLMDSCTLAAVTADVIESICGNLAAPLHCLRPGKRPLCKSICNDNAMTKKLASEKGVLYMKHGGCWLCIPDDAQQAAAFANLCMEKIR